MSSYEDTVNYLYSCTPQFQMIGAAAYKPGLDTARSLDRAFGSPHLRYKTIHVAGTNGKGSTAHTLAAILQSAGYKVGLYTSPHLVDFRERIRVNGEMISREGVVDFVNRYRSMAIDCEPSFFELTTIMAFDWFSSQGVDVAVIETGLGGRLDTTNIITPLLSVITNISFDHVAQLGNTLQSIAFEKAGIIKPGVPVIVGEAEGDIAEVFALKAKSENSPITFACKNRYWMSAEVAADANIYKGTRWGDITGNLTGECQLRNAATVVAALDLLSDSFDFSAENVLSGFADVTVATGLMGRWMKICDTPLTICDTGHNTGGWQYTEKRLARMPRPLSMVIGFVNDKDVDHILDLMPEDADYYFTQASIPRAMSADILAEKAQRFGLSGIIVPDVKQAVSRAQKTAGNAGSVFIGGSTFVVADYLKSL